MPSQSDLLFGQIALRKGFLNQATLDQILAEQADLERDGISAPLGKILIGRRMLRPDQVDLILAEQKYVELRAEDKKLGVLAVRNGFATQEQVHQALAAQKADHLRSGAVPERIGAWFARLGILQPQQVEALARAQKRLGAAPAAGTPQAPPAPSAARAAPPPRPGQSQPQPSGRPPMPPPAAHPAPPAPPPPPGWGTPSSPPPAHPARPAQAPPPGWGAPTAPPPAIPSAESDMPFVDQVAATVPLPSLAAEIADTVPSPAPQGFTPPPSASSVARAVYGTASPHASVPAPLPAPSPPSAPVARLTVEAGESPGRTIELWGVMTIGRKSDSGAAQIQLDDKRASGRHAFLEPTAEGYRITDLESRNGTLLNGEKLSGSAVLRPGDRVQIGAHILRFQWLEQSAVAPIEGGVLPPISGTQTTLEARGDGTAPHAASSADAPNLTVVAVVAGILLLAAAAYFTRDRWLPLLQGFAAAKEAGTGTPIANAPAPDAPPETFALLARLRKDLNAGEDLDALAQRLTELRGRVDPTNRDARFDSVAEEIENARASRAEAAWGPLSSKVEALRKENRFAEAMTRLHSVPSTPTLAPKRDELAARVRETAEQWLVMVRKQTREEVASGKRDAAYEQLTLARETLPPEMHPQVDDLETQLREFAAKIDAREGNKAAADPKSTTPDGSGSDPAGSGKDPAGSGSDPAGAGKDPAGSGTDPAGSGSDPAGTGTPASGTDPSAFGTGSPTGGTPTSGTPGISSDPAARAASEARTAASRAHLEQVQRGLEERKYARAAQARKEAARVAERTARTPIDIEINPGQPLQDITISEYTDERITLKSPQATFPITWEAMPARAAYDVRRLAIEDTAEAHLALGKYCLLRGLLDQADREFKRVLELDAGFAKRVPDTQVFRDRRKLFRGVWSQVGRDLLRISWEFAEPEEVADFDSQAKLSVNKGFLEIAGSDPVSIAVVRGLDFSEFVTLEVAGAQGAGASPVVGLLFKDKTGRQTGSLAFVDPSGTQISVVRIEDVKTTPVTPPVKIPKDSAIEVRLASLKIEVRVKGKKIWSGAQSEFSNCWVVVGCAPVKGSGVARFQRVRVEGKAGAEWIRKSLSANDTLALRELEDDLRGRDTIATGAPAEVKLSVEDRLAQLPERARDRYLWAKGMIEKRDLSRPNDIVKALNEGVEAAPDFAGLYYYRGRFLEQLDQPGQAIPEYGRAIGLAPEFAEAWAARGRCWADVSRDPEAGKDAEEALRLAPDLAAGHHVRGKVLFGLGRRDESVAELELADALDPADQEIRLLWKGIRNVIRGPLWKQTYRAESPHFVVRTDVSQARAEFYAKHLEAIAGFYAQTFAIELPARKADGLVFETQEGYQTYAELTLENRVESTLGYYHPVYDQLLLFEDKTEGAGPETLRVLYHEGFHQFIHRIIPHMPYWLNEGVAEYFGASEVKDGKVARTGLVQEGRLAGLQSFLAQGGKPIPFADIMLQSPGDFYSGNVPLKYAQAWSMVHYFMEAGKASYRPVLQSYVDALRAGESNEAAFRKTFAALDLQLAEKQWLAAVRKLKLE